jgi:hypothetical protein
VIEDVLEAAVANQCVKESTPRTLIQNLFQAAQPIALPPGAKRALKHAYACRRLVRHERDNGSGHLSPRRGRL